MSKPADYEKEIYRVFRFYQAMIDYLDIFFECHRLGILSTDTLLYSNKLYIQLCDKMKGTLSRPGFKDSIRWRPYKTLTSLDYVAIDNWEVNVRPGCIKLLGVIQELFIREGEQECSLCEDDESLFRDIHGSIESMKALKRGYWGESSIQNEESLISSEVSREQGVDDDAQPIVGPAESYSIDDHVFLKQGETWLIVYDGVPKSLRHSLGMSYICHLLQNPGQEIHAISMREMLTQNISYSSTTEEVIDKKALEEYKMRLKEIDEEMDEAEYNQDLASKARLNDERETLLSEISRATDRSGQPRKISTDRERARQSVSKAIHTALDSIKKEHEALWYHFNNSIKIGEYLSYQPDQPTSWITN